MSETLARIVASLKHENDLYLPLILFIFDKEIVKFHSTKRMTKGVKEKDEFNESEEEENEEEFS